MNSAPLISIIIPVYNAEQYLQRCIDSVLNQTSTNFEILLIDDGSIDESIKICNKYKEKDSRIKVINKTNGGVSSARNMGIENAQGKLITFIDSDDFIEDKMLEILMARSNCDLVVSGIKTSDNKTHQLNTIEYIDKKEISNAINSLLKSVLFKSPCGKLYHRDIIKEHNIRFDSRIRYGEDVLFNLTYLKYCNSIKITSKCFYIYFCQETNANVCSKYNLTIKEIQSLTNQVYKQTKQLEKKFQKIISIDYLSEFISKYPIDNILNNDNEYFGLYKAYSSNKSRQYFYNNVSISPILRSIAEIKEYYANNDIEKGKNLTKKLHSYINNKNRINNFPYNDFRLWHYLIKNNMLYTAHYLLHTYSFFKTNKFQQPNKQKDSY